MHFNQKNEQPQQTTLPHQYLQDYKLDSSLPDTLSDIKWCHTSPQQNLPYFAGTCWDKTLRIFEVSGLQSAVYERDRIELPSIATCLEWKNDNSLIFVGCMDGVIRAINIYSEKIVELGKHEAGINSLNYVPQFNTLASTAYQNKICFWQNQNQIAKVYAQNKVFCAHYSNGVLAGATHEEKIFFTDFKMVKNKMLNIYDSLELGKDSQIQTLSLNKTASHIALSTIDGRTNISKIFHRTDSHKMSTVITFKSNKSEGKTGPVLYPTNACCYNPVINDWILTAGSDGQMILWDFQSKNRIKLLNYEIPVCKSSVSPNGQMIAYSLGNDWHIGQQGIGKWPSLLGVHQITEDQKKFIK